MSEQQPQTIAAYLRVSTAEQSTDAQIDAIHAAGIDPVRVFAEHRSGAAGSERPEWEACLGWLRPGDVLVVAGTSDAIESARRLVTKKLKRGRPVAGTSVAAPASRGVCTSDQR